MTSPNQILVSLTDSPATTNALHDLMRLPFLVIEAMCKRHVKDGFVTTSSLADCSDIWSLTDSGREAAGRLVSAANSNS